MNRKIHFGSSAVLLCGCSLLTIQALGQHVYESVFGDIGPDVAYGLTELGDSSIVIIGTSRNIDALWYLNFARLDVVGDTMWSTYPSGQTFYPGNSFGYSVVNVGDSLLVGVGKRFAPTSPVQILSCAIAMNINGDTLWTKTYSAPSESNAQDIVQTTDGNLLLAGYNWTFGVGVHFMASKITLTGDTVWTRYYDHDPDQSGQVFGLAGTQDGGAALLGITFPSLVPGLNDIQLMRIDQFGDTLWVRTYYAPNDDHGYDIAATDDGGFVIAGATRSIGAGGYDAYVMKVDSTGDIEWTTTQGGLDDDWANALTVTSDGGILVAGSTQSFSVGGYDCFIFKLDSAGTLVWQRTYGGVNDDIAYAIESTHDGGLVFAGQRGNDYYVVKTNSEGIVVGMNELEYPHTAQIHVFPNPATDQIRIATAIEGVCEIEIYDATGILLNAFQSIPSEQTFFDCTGLSAGLYFLSVHNHEGTAAKASFVVTR